MPAQMTAEFAKKLQNGLTDLIVSYGAQGISVGDARRGVVGQTGRPHPSSPSHAGACTRAGYPCWFNVNMQAIAGQALIDATIRIMRVDEMAIANMATGLPGRAWFAGLHAGYLNIKLATLTAWCPPPSARGAQDQRRRRPGAACIQCCSTALCPGGTGQPGPQYCINAVAPGSAIMASTLSSAGLALSQFVPVSSACRREVMQRALC